MSIRAIHLLGSPVLRQRAAEVERVDAKTTALIADLFDTMRADKGVGLAANQIGVARRVLVIAPDDEQPPLALINPVIVEHSGSTVAEEGCLSIPDIYADIDRAQRILVETTTPEGTRTRFEATDLRARVIQHEVDHLDGILFVDRVGPLKRRLLLNKWRRLRKGKVGHLKEVVPATVED